MRKIIISVMLFAAGALGISCSSAPKVTRVDVEEQIDITGRWNDTDAQLAAEEMIADCTAKPWLENFYKTEGKNPTVIVGHVANRTDEHINVGVFVKNLERELLNAGKVRFVASPEERQQLRAEREDQQQGYTLPETMAEMGRELGADFMLIGSLNSVVDEYKGKFVVLYQVNLELVDLQNNAKVWIGRKEIKKYVERGRYSL